MASESVYQTLELTPTFLADHISNDFTATDRKRFLQALRLLNTNEQHPSLRVHALQGKLKGAWSVSASDELRIPFIRLDDGRKLIQSCSRHYQR
jgi:mRNA-degrading endonuclease YafQ of YafQ-DinJ toxin-antitoxin module